MPIKIEITGEHMGDIDLALNALHRPDPRTMPLDDLLAITKARFFEAGFVIDVTGTDTPLPPIEIPPAEAEAIVENIEKALVEPKRRGRPPAATAAKKPPAPDPQLEADKTYVVEEMTKRFGDPKQKLKAKAFIDVVTGRNGGVRLSLLPAELFPEIKAEMEAEFAIPPRKNGGGEAHV